MPIPDVVHSVRPK